MVQHINRIVDVPVVMQRQALMIQPCRTPWSSHRSSTLRSSSLSQLSHNAKYQPSRQYTRWWRFLRVSVSIMRWTSRGHEATDLIDLEEIPEMPLIDGASDVPTREHARYSVRKCRRIRENTSVVQNRFGFPENSVDHFAKMVENRASSAMAPAVRR